MAAAGRDVGSVVFIQLTYDLRLVHPRLGVLEDRDMHISMCTQECKRVGGCACFCEGEAVSHCYTLI